MDLESPKLPNFKRISLATALIGQKCPKCRQGKLFQYPTLNLRKFTEMNTRCPSCEQDFEIEPGFYWGAMFVSYGLSLVWILPLIAFMFFVLDASSEWAYIGAISVIIFFTAPFNFRYSRTVFLHMFSPVKYDSKAAYPFDVKNLMVEFPEVNGSKKLPEEKGT